MSAPNNGQPSVTGQLNNAANIGARLGGATSPIGIAGNLGGSAIQGLLPGQFGNTAGAAVKGASTGAAIGSIVPGLGAAIGAVGGGLLGALTSLF